MRVLLLLPLLVGCPGADKGEDSAPATPAPALADAGSVISGDAGDLAGSALADAGDRDGDGLSELIVGALGARIACVVGGPFGGDLALRAARTCIEQEADFDFLGQGVAGGRDVDGDGLPDLLVGGPGSDAAASDAGKVWLLGTLAAGTVGVADAGGVAWTGEAAADGAGSVVSFGGDLDGDGVEDLVIGAPGSDRTGREGGAAYVVSGQSSGGALADAAFVVAGRSELDDTPAKHAADVLGEGVGTALCRGGDLDGDGLDDLVIGAPGMDTGGENAGGVGIYAGPLPVGAFTLEDADTLLVASRAGGYAGGALACGGDTDGDGLGEVLIGADADGGGRVYLWRGGTLDRSAVIFEGADAEQAGYAVAFVGGGGIDGVAIGSASADSPAIDAGGVAWFRAPLAAGTVALADAEGRWTGSDAGDLAGTALAALADIDGAGTLGLAVGAPYNADTAPIGGAVYVVPLPD